MTAVGIEGLNKSFGGVQVLKGINLLIEEGEFVVIVGPSGCGKSTLLRIVSGLEEVSSGNVRFGDTDVTHVEPGKRKVAMVFQSYALYPHMTVAENIGFATRAHGESKEKTSERVAEIASTLKLTDYLDRLPSELSGGQKQRVAIGRAIIRDPNLFLFDEPLSNLDAELRVEMRLELMELHKRLKRTMIYVTHDQVEAMTLADRIVLLRDGELEQVGRPHDLYHDPDNMFVAGFLGSPKLSFLDSRVEAAGDGTSRLKLITDPDVIFETSVKVPSEREIKIGLRPEKLQRSKEGALSIVPTVVEDLGGSTIVHGRTPGGASMAVQCPPQSDISLHEPLSLQVGSEDLLLFDAQSGKRLR